ncbi:MAG: hypothetical protein RBU21_17525 [FCB group bacterium]|jgi:hypothetical protein|nr:hypothetical protein [FCB group bacterium]
MMDLNTYLLYGLFLSRLREQAEADGAKQRRPRTVRFNFLAWTLASLGSTLIKSGRTLKERYEPMVRTRPQISN